MTNVGPVQMRVEVDFADSERKLKELQANLQRQNRLAASIQERVLKTTGAKLPGTGGEARPRAGGESMTDRLLQAAARQSDRAGISRFGAAATGAAARFLPEGAAKVAKTAGAVALGYAATSGAAQVSPVVLEGLRAALPDLLGNSPEMKALQTGLEHLRESFAAFESGVKSIFTAGAKTADLAIAGMRLSGQVPNIAYYQDQNMKADSYEDRLRKKFNEFKAKEVSQAIGRTVGQAVSRSLNQ